jgi:hypothetical protein
MTHTKHTQPTRRKITVGAAAGLALIVGLAVRADGQPQTPHSRVAAETLAVADWARAQGLTGLSPASLRAASQPGPDLATQLEAERAAIAAWARSQGLSGLSPASLAPAG